MNEIFRLIGNKPDNLFKHFLYMFLRFKIFKKQVNKKRIIYTRLILDKDYGDDFSLIDYFKTISLKRFLKVIIFNTLKFVVGKNLILKLKR